MSSRSSPPRVPLGYSGCRRWQASFSATRRKRSRLSSLRERPGNTVSGSPLRCDGRWRYGAPPRTVLSEKDETRNVKVMHRELWLRAAHESVPSHSTSAVVMSTTGLRNHAELFQQSFGLRRLFFRMAQAPIQMPGGLEF